MKEKRNRGKRQARNDTAKKHIELYQPQAHGDFGALFRTSSDAPIQFEVRTMSENELHDIIYISSYTHDGEFRLDELQWRGRTLIIPMNRARWELAWRLKDLRSVRSELVIRPVKSFRLELVSEYDFTINDYLRSPKLIISSISVEPSDWRDKKGLTIRCAHGERLCLQIPDDYKMRLTDSVK